jgi:hypothetical protein
LVGELVHTKVVLVRRCAVCLCQYRLRLSASAHCDQEEQTGLMRLQNAVHGGAKICGTGAGMLKHNQAFTFVRPLKHGQAILDCHQVGSISGAPGARLGKHGEQTVTQVRRGDWQVWVQSGASVVPPRENAPFIAQVRPLLESARPKRARAGVAHYREARDKANWLRWGLVREQMLRVGRRGARQARREEEEYSTYCDDEQRRQPGWIAVQIVADIL